MTRCLACKSPRVIDIDAELNAGKPISSVARLTGVPYDSIKRHKRNGHITPPPSMSPTVLPAVTGDSPEAVIRSIVASLGAVDVSKMSTTATLALFAERRRAAESLSRIAGPNQASATEAEAEVAAARELIAGYDEFLESRPDVRKELSTMMRAKIAAR